MHRLRVEFKFVYLKKKILLVFQCICLLNSEEYVPSHLTLTIHAHFVILHSIINSNVFYFWKIIGIRKRGC